MPLPKTTTKKASTVISLTHSEWPINIFYSEKKNQAKASA